MGEDPLSRSRKEGQGLPRASMERAEFGQESGFHSSCPNPCRGGASGSGREAVSSQVFLGRAWPGIFSINLECSTFASVPSYSFGFLGPCSKCSWGTLALFTKGKH